MTFVSESSTQYKYNFKTTHEKCYKCDKHLTELNDTTAY